MNYINIFLSRNTEGLLIATANDGPIGTQYDDNEQEFVFSRPDEFVGTDLYLLMRNEKEAFSPINIGENDGFIIPEMFTHGRILSLQVMFGSPGMWRAGTNMLEFALREGMLDVVSADTYVRTETGLITKIRETGEVFEYWSDTDQTWKQMAGGGVSDHSKLSNLSYANSGHTGFATSEQGAKADTALQSETDPTVPTWAKAAQKPSYSASEVGAATPADVASSEAVAMSYDPGTRVLTLTKGDGSTLTWTVPQANAVQDGFMTGADISTIADLVSKVNSLVEGGLWRATFDTYADMVSAYPGLDVSGTNWFVNDYVFVIHDENYDSTNQPETSYIVEVSGDVKTLAFRKYENGDGALTPTVSTATNTSLGVVKGNAANTPGKIYIETDGSMTQIGYDATQTAIAGKITKVASPVPGNFAVLTVDGSIFDSGFRVASFAAKETTYTKTETDALLQSKADSSGLSPTLFTILAASWASDTTYTDYPFRASLSIVGLTEDDRVDIAFTPIGVSYALDAEVLPSNSSFTGGVYLYAKAVPAGLLSGNYIVYKAVT